MLRINPVVSNITFTDEDIVYKSKGIIIDNNKINRYLIGVDFYRLEEDLITRAIIPERTIQNFELDFIFGNNSSLKYCLERLENLIRAIDINYEDFTVMFSDYETIRLFDDMCKKILGKILLNKRESGRNFDIIDVTGQMIFRSKG